MSTKLPNDIAADQREREEAARIELEQEIFTRSGGIAMGNDDKNNSIMIINSESGQLLRMAIEKDLDVEKLRALMDLRDREDRHRAEREFETNFAKMQNDYIPAFKNKTVETSNGKTAYSYCPLPQILSVYAPILARHGFSYRWEEDEVEGKTEKRTTCFLSGYGFTRQASISLPYGSTNQLVNPIQARGATSEYGRRYTFMNVTGCIVADEMDSDGRIEPARQNRPTQPIQPARTAASATPAQPSGSSSPIKFPISDSARGQIIDMLREMAWPEKRQELVFQRAAIVGEEKALDGITAEYQKFLAARAQEEGAL